MHGWTDRDDSQQCCDGQFGPVSNEEEIARLLHSKIVQPYAEPIRRGELFPAGGNAPSNLCGDADGVSILRLMGLAEQAILDKAMAQANKRPDRETKGAIIAKALKLRNISLSELGDQQIVFVYDDPRDDEPLHAVIRGNSDVTRANQDFVRSKICELFDRLISP